MPPAWQRFHAEKQTRGANLAVLLAALRQLTPRERQVFELCFGVHDGEPKTLDAVGQVFGVSREPIRQIEAKALR